MLQTVSICVLLLAIGCSMAKHVELPAPYTDHCILDDKTNLYDPSKQFDIQWFDINLDLPPSERWKQVAGAYKVQIKELIGVLIELISPIFPNAVDWADDVFGEMALKLPQPYRDEIMSISQVTGIPLGQITMYNVFYEIFTVCTSIIAQDKDGHLTHARNLDFGLFLGWDPVAHEWQISQKLRKIIINVNWIKDGKLLFKSNNFAGYVGIYNGLKPGAFSLTANERYQLEGGYYGMLKWAFGLEADGKWMSWLARETFELKNSYLDAKEHLMNTPMLSPVYYILGGVNKNEGCIITRSLNGTALLTELADAKNGWYLLQTNYDQDQQDLYLDDRDTPGDRCMDKLSQKNAGFQGVFNVLSSRTNLNKLTTYTVLMSVETARFETILQSCPGECYPW